MAVVPIEKDPLSGPTPIEILARVTAQMESPTAPLPLTETTLDTVRKPTR